MPIKSEEAKKNLARWLECNKGYLRHYGAERRDRIRREMVAAYGGKCRLCGEGDPVILVLDHIDDTGYTERKRPAGAGGVQLYSRLKRQGWPAGKYQLLCHNCNYRKEFNRRRAVAEVNFTEAPVVPTPRRSAEDIVCLHCGATFYRNPVFVRRGAKFCSTTCAGAYKRTESMKPCERCGAAIRVTPATATKRRFCSRACRGKSQCSHLAAGARDAALARWEGKKKGESDGSIVQ